MLSNIPLVEALRYTTEQAQRKVKVEAFAVKIVPLSDVGDELLTKVYRVPPNFLNLGGDVTALADYSNSRIDAFKACITHS